MKIIHVFWGLGIGGIENMLADIVNRQVHSQEVHLIIVNDIVDKQLSDRIDIRCKIHFLKRKTGSRNPFFFLKLNYLIYKLHPDVIHYHDAALKRLVYISAPSLITIHNTHLPTSFYSRKDLLIAISKAVHDDVLQRSGYFSKIIENGVDVSSIQIRTKQYNPDHFRIVQIGRLFHSQKGQDVLISAMEQLIHQSGLTQLRLEFIGDGESRTYLEEMVKKKNLSPYISFLGNKDRTYIYEHLKEYDLFVQPSRFEGFGLTVVEALSAQLPVLVSNNDGPMELIEFGKYGRYFENENVSDCARSIQDVFFNYPTNIFLQEAYDHALRNYSIDHMVQQYENIYALQYKCALKMSNK